MVPATLKHTRLRSDPRAELPSLNSETPAARTWARLQMLLMRLLLNPLGWLAVLVFGALTLVAAPLEPERVRAAEAVGFHIHPLLRAFFALKVGLQVAGCWLVAVAILVGAVGNPWFLAWFARRRPLHVWIGCFLMVTATLFGMGLCMISIRILLYAAPPIPLPFLLPRLP